MKGVFLPGTEEAHLNEWPDPTITENDVLIEIKASALCRSDMSIYHGRPLIPGFPPGTFIPGHEPCGVIVEVGKRVRHFKDGNRVAVTCFVSCETCKYCRAGEPMLCDNSQALGFQRHGGDAEYLVVPESVCLLMPDKMSYVTGAVSTDAIGNLYATMKEMSVCGNDLIAIVGLGPMGLSGVLAAKGMAATVVAIDVIGSRVEKARDMGADYAINAAETDPREYVKSINKEGADKVVECSGSSEGIDTALDITRKRGIVAQVGEPGEGKVGIYPSEQLIRKKLTYYGSWYFKLHEWDEIADFIVNKIGNERAEEIVSHRLPLEENSIAEGFKLFDERKTYKVVFTP